MKNWNSGLGSWYNWTGDYGISNGAIQLFRTSSEWASGVFDLQRIETGAFELSATFRVLPGTNPNPALDDSLVWWPSVWWTPVGVMLMFPVWVHRATATASSRATRQ